MKDKIKRTINDIIFIWQFSLEDFRLKYAGSVAGFAWAILNPISTILIYWFIFQVGFKSQPVENVPYILWLISGLLPWFFLSEAIPSSAACMVEYSYLVKKIRFNINILPLIKVFSILYIQIVLNVVLMILFCVYGYWPSYYYFQLIYYLIYMIVFTVGIAYLISTIYVFFKDTIQIVTILLQVVFWTTPIVWSLDIFSEPVIRQVLMKTPVFFIVNGFRNTYINKIWFWQDELVELYYWAIAFAVLLVGICCFRKCKTHFADVL